MAHSGSIFKSICEDILEPRGVKVGGYKDDIFDSLNEKDREEISCQICFMVAKDAHTCSNSHLFCGTCIFAWSMTSEGNTDRCPACRVRGSYNSAEASSAKINNMAVRCLRCKWKGQVSDYRSHNHGLEDAGIDPKSANLPSVWSSDGKSVFPDLASSENIDETIESSRRRHQRRYLDTQLELIEGQARLTFLLDLFEEDLQRHRDNLNTMVRLQRRYNAEQFNEVMRLETELGQITANLLGLIESANNDVDTMTNRLRSDTRQTYPSVASSNVTSAIRSTLSRLSSSSLGAEASYSPSVVEPREPIRRARFFRVNSQQTRVAPATTPSSDAAMLTERLLARREISHPNTTGNQAGADNSSILNTPRIHSSNYASLPTAVTSNTLPRETTSAANTLVYPTPRPPPRTTGPLRASENPFTITWPPASSNTNISAAASSRIVRPAPPGASSSSTTTSSVSTAGRSVTRQEVRQNALERSRRTNGDLT